MTVHVGELVPSTEPCNKLVGAVSAFFAKLAARKVKKLDLEVMPDRVKRDLGFLDGREPRYEDERLR
ncbi:MAG: hypothetical protein ABWY49_01280 [Rhizobium sp.]